ncbi:3'-5' exonuclease [Microbacterium xylanilyticum]
MKPTEEQQHAIDLFAGGGNVVVEALAGTGKALRNDQRVLTDEGWVPIGDVTINHRAYGSDGKAHAITGVFPQGQRPLFRVVISDGTEIYADGDHRWTVENTFDRSAKPGFTARVMTTLELIRHGVRSPKGRAKWYLPPLAPIDRDDVELPIDPWLLGVILGDGCISASLAISMPDPEILARVRGIVEPLGVQVRRNGSDESCIDYRISSRRSRPGRKGFWNPLLDALNDLGLRAAAQTLATKSNVKFVPEQYLRASASQRLELLRGLLDTDGTRGTGPNSFEFYSMSVDLADAVVSLVRSLGGTARRKSKRSAVKGAHGARYDESFRVYGVFPSAVCPFWLPRKAADWGLGARLEPFRTIASISPAPAAEATCIAVDAPDSLYVTEGYVLTHNTSTLRFMADVGAARRRRGLYAAFTKGVQLEAQRKFHGTGVQARTMHSLAFAEFGKPMQHRLGKQPPMRPTERAQILGINDKYLLTAADGSGLPGALSRQQLVSYTGHTMKAFLGSTAEHVDPGMVYLPPTLAPKLNERGEARLRATIAEFAEAYWRDLQDPNGRMKYLPDAYLKSWYHSHPVLPFDYVMFDECQPSDTVVWALEDGHGNFKNRIRPVTIDTLREGDRVVSYNKNGRLRAHGARVAGISSRHFTGDLVTVKTDSGLTSSYTPNHRCIAVLGPAFLGKHAVYLMRRGDSYRIGVTGPRTVARSRTADWSGRAMPLGLATRISEEKADAIWVLSLHETRAEARLAEECVSAKFGIPQTRFIAGQGRLDVTQERLDEFWREFSDNSDRAEAALRAHNRDIRYPFTSRGESRSLTYWRPREIRAVNLVDGMLVLDATVMVDTNGQWNRGATTPIRVGRRGYDDRVWSMTIDPDQTYVGDGIVTHNCQDADAIITAVLLEQDTQIVAVGDRNQQIYEWRGANSAMDAFGGERATLRKSFRFGPAIADYANGWLDAIGAPVDMRLIPSDKLSTVRRRTPFTGRQPDGVLTRTNATAIDEIVTAQEEGIAVGIAGEKKAQELRELAQAAEDLQERGWTKHPELSVFNTWSDVRTHAESEDGEDLRPLVALVDRVGARQVGRAIDRCVPVQDARTTVSTAHVAKGLEWPQVHIADDFREPKPGEPMPAEEARLAYVAATRAMRFLDPYGLEWFERFRADGGVVAGAETPVSAQTGSTVATSAGGGM